MAEQTMETTAELVGGPKCGERMPIFSRAVDLVAAGKTYTVRIPAYHAPVHAGHHHLYELRFRPDRFDGALMRAVLWYRGMEGA